MSNGVRRLGSLDIKVVSDTLFEMAFGTRPSKRFLPVPEADADRLFLYGAQFDLKRHTERLAELGLLNLAAPIPHVPSTETDDRREPIEDARRHLQEEWARIEIECGESTTADLGRRQVPEALGASAASIEYFDDSAPSAWKKFGTAEAEAWFLVNFIRYSNTAYDANAPMDARLNYAIALRRLVEWWRWRNEGHDRRAFGKRKSEAAVPKAAAARYEKAAQNQPLWWDDARQLDTSIFHRSDVL